MAQPPTGEGLPELSKMCPEQSIRCLVACGQVMNGAMLFWPIPNALYVEGYSLDRFAAGEWGLQAVHSNKVRVHRTRGGGISRVQSTFPPRPVFMWSVPPSREAVACRPCPSACAWRCALAGGAGAGRGHRGRADAAPPAGS